MLKIRVAFTVALFVGIAGCSSAPTALPAKTITVSAKTITATATVTVTQQASEMVPQATDVLPPTPTSTLPTTRSWESAADMRNRLDQWFTLADCNKPAVDINGAVYVECSLPRRPVEGTLLRMETIRADQVEQTAASLDSTGWLVRASAAGWIVAVNAQDKAALDRAWNALKK